LSIIRSNFSKSVIAFSPFVRRTLDRLLAACY
jgi:hypothetical protein